MDGSYSLSGFIVLFVELSSSFNKPYILVYENQHSERSSDNTVSDAEMASHIRNLS